MATVLVRCVREDSKTFIIGTGTWRILSDGLDGIDAPSFSVYSDKNAIGDGAIVSGKRINDRDVQIKCRNTNPKANATVRAAALAFFNPKYSFKIYITYQGVTRWADAELEGFSCPSENVHRPITMTIKFYCASGFFKSVDDFGKDIASITGGFGFPYIDVTTPLIPVYASIYNYNQEVTITNDGDVPTYPRVTISFSGDVTNPRIYKDDYYVRILDSFVDGDVVVIDFENCTITKNGENWIHYIDRSSQFTSIVLETGDSILGFGADDGDAYMSVRIYYNKLYLGL